MIQGEKKSQGEIKAEPHFVVSFPLFLIFFPFWRGGPFNPWRRSKTNKKEDFRDVFFLKHLSGGQTRDKCSANKQTKVDFSGGLWNWENSFSRLDNFQRRHLSPSSAFQLRGRAIAPLFSDIGGEDRDENTRKVWTKRIFHQTY